MGRTTRYFERTAHNISGLTDNIDGVTGNFKRMMTINRAMSDNFAHMQAIPASRRPCKSGCAGMIDAQPRALQPYSPLPYKPVGQQRRREPLPIRLYISLHFHSRASRSISPPNARTDAPT
ncbi:hypothetical protein [Sphingobacterium corticibacterium]|uniref:Uncharacterized protein n=1 Tax=Sphingobacterium corticibacterium TaxID=2484746 RepID=A0A4Q6XU04_9SPHI|nr:hypothetical protein [Sphingobacterium corticibacterium]RZF60087.1 hypothetical protein EWE74_13280 [Sphingobacterium corticibacterium]